MGTVRYYHTGIAARHTATLLMTGLVAGVINGLLGTGGGIVVVLVLTAWYKRLCGNSASRADVAKSVYVISLLTMLPVSPEPEPMINRSPAPMAGVTLSPTT